MSEPLPLTTFNFELEITIGGGQVWQAGFTECEGLEMSMDPVTIREGGNNGQPIHLPGPVSYGQLTLRRGLASEVAQLWQWFEDAQTSVWVQKKRLISSAVVRVLSSDRTRTVQFQLVGCVPVRVRAPSLNALNGGVAIEEIQLAYEFFYRMSG